MKRTTILILTSIRINSGSGFRVSGIAKYLAKRGYDVTLTGIGKPFGKDGSSARYIGVPDLVSFLFLVPLVFIVNLAVTLFSRPGLLIVSKPLPSSFLPAWLVSLFTGAKIVLDFDDLEHDYWRDSRLLSSFLRRFEKFALLKTDAVTTHSPDLAEYLLKNYTGINLWSLPQGIDIELFPKAAAPVKEDTALQGKKVLVYAAHFNVASRDFYTVLDVFKRLAADVDDVVLLAIGDGPLFSHYRDYARKAGLDGRVVFTGYVPHSSIGRYFAAGDIALNYLSATPANRCRASIKLREYLFSGMTVVCNDIGQDVEHFKPYVTIFSDTGSDGLYDTLKQCLAALVPGARNTAARDYINSQWGWENVLQPFIGKLEKDLLRAEKIA